MSRSLASSSSSSWMSHLPLVLLGLRTTIRPDAECCPADVVFGTQLRLPGDLLVPPPALLPDPVPFVADLGASMASLRPILPVRRGPPDPGQIPASLSTISHVFLRVDAVKRPLTPPYDGPFAVLERSAKTFKILKNNKSVTVSIDRVKPAFLSALPDSPIAAPAVPPVAVPPSVHESVAVSRFGRPLRPPSRF